MKSFISSITLIICLVTALPCAADLFTSSDATLTMDMPAGWTRAKEVSPNNILSLQKGDARIDVKTITCTSEACLDQSINRDLAEVKTKQMTVLKNTYTDEEIKRIEFSTGEPFYYIHFYTPKNDFSAGYFLLNTKGYSILAKNITYAEADLIFASIAPVTQPTQDTPVSPTVQDDVEEIDLLSSPNTPTIPDIEVENLNEPAPIQQSAISSNPVVSSTKTTAILSPAKRILHKLKIRWKRWPIHTLVTPGLPPYIHHLGHGYDALILLLGFFVIMWCGTGLVRPFVRARHLDTSANPNSLYPVKLERLYGTPSMIFRARDNQGNVLTALSTRWDALIRFTGIILMLMALIIMAITSFCEQLHLLPVSAFSYNIIYSTASLVLPLGFLIFFCAIVWGQVIMNEVILFDRKGKKAAILRQKGYSLLQEKYQLFFVNSKELLLAQRKRFTLRRHWTLMSKDYIEFATIKERSTCKAIIRMLCGHLWGMLRADYDISGSMESTGAIENTHALFNKALCNIDKPDAVNARDLLALSLLISIRDRDKWYPWFN